VHVLVFYPLLNLKMHGETLKYTFLVVCAQFFTNVCSFNKQLRRSIENYIPRTVISMCLCSNILFQISFFCTKRRGGKEWDDVDQDTDKWRALVKTVMNFRVS
jgi:hypothetical protein